MVLGYVGCYSQGLFPLGHIYAGESRAIGRYLPLNLVAFGAIGAAAGIDRDMQKASAKFLVTAGACIYVYNAFSQIRDAGRAVDRHNQKLRAKYQLVFSVPDGGGGAAAMAVHF
jgi:hypothetical protein